MHNVLVFMISSVNVIIKKNINEKIRTIITHKVRHLQNVIERNIFRNVRIMKYERDILRTVVANMIPKK